MNSNLNAVFAALIERDIEKLKSEIKAYTDEDKLWLTTGTIKNSGGNLCLHITGALNYFVGALLGGSGYIRNYDEEFILKGISKQQLVDDLEKTKVVVTDTLNQLTVEDLNKMYPKKWQEEEVPTYWFLSHLLTHINYHLGQINYHRRIINPS